MSGFIDTGSVALTADGSKIVSRHGDGNIRYALCACFHYLLTIRTPIASTIELAQMLGLLL